MWCFPLIYKNSRSRPPLTATEDSFSHVARLVNEGKARPHVSPNTELEIAELPAPFCDLEAVIGLEACQPLVRIWLPHSFLHSGESGAECSRSAIPSHVLASS